MPTIKKQIEDLNYVDIAGKLRSLLTRVSAGTITQAEAITALGDTTDLTAIAASYADLAAARESVNTLRTDAEARLVAIEAKVDAIIAALKTAGVIAI